MKSKITELLERLKAKGSSAVDTVKAKGSSVAGTVKTKCSSAAGFVKTKAGLAVEIVKGWSRPRQIAAGGATVAVVAGIIGGVVYYNVSNNQEVVEPVVVAEVVEIEEEEEEEVVTVEPTTFQTVGMSYDSMEKDITVYFTDEDGSRISGQEFSAKIVSEDDADELSELISAIEEARENRLAYLAGERTTTDDEESADVESTDATDEEDSGDSDDSEVSTEDLNEEAAVAVLSNEELTEYAEYVAAEEEAMDAYATALAEVDGTTLVDENQDGMIEESDLESGDVVVMYVPVDGYEASSYSMDATIKEELEYEVVDVSLKEVEYSAADDPEPETPVTTVEATPTDTVTYVESSKEEVAAKYGTSSVGTAPASSGGTVTIAEDGTSSTATATVYSSVTKNGANTATINLSLASGISDVSVASSNESALSASCDGSSITVTAADGVTSNTDVTVTVTYQYSVATSTEGTETEGTQTDDTQTEGTTPEETAGASIGRTSFLGQATIGKIPFVSSILERIGKGILLATGDTPTVTTETGTTTITVHVVGTSTQLTNSSGETLYIDSTGTTPATTGTYDNTSTYYVQTQAGYTIYYGWQTLSAGTYYIPARGSMNLVAGRYYFDSTGNYVTGSQTIGGNTYTFGSDGVLLTGGNGIDVSKWQGNIDWSQVKTVASFAIIRAGYRGSSGGIAEDPYAGTNIKGASAAGVKVGLYFYSMATTEAQAVEEASLAVSIAQKYGSISLPIYIDMESSVQASLTTAQRDAIVQAFCKTVQSAGYKAGVYANYNWLTTKLTPSSYGSSISIWIARYNTYTGYSGRYDIWQYSSSGTVPGISGNVDLNISYF